MAEKKPLEGGADFVAKLVEDPKQPPQVLMLKGFLGATVAPLNAVARLNATVAANVAAILAGAHIVRVHDLQEAREAVAVADAITASALPFLLP